jgi:hypothetical protein
MAIQLTAEDARQSLTAHVEGKGIEAYLKFGPHIGWPELQRLLADRVFVRYPVEIVFDATSLQPGEFAVPIPKGERPEEGFTMCVHPCFEQNLHQIAYPVLYQLVAVNYGEFASHEEAETFGAAALGITRDEYYEALCAISDQLGGSAPDINPAEIPGGCSGGGCSCG